MLGDSRRLRQIFDNVLSNAIKCTDPVRSRFAPAKTDDSITVEVSDTGRGIHRGILAARLRGVPAERRQPTRASASGSGSRSHASSSSFMAERSRRSEGEGLGATFTVTLPRVRTDAGEESTQHTIAGVRVLLIDDDVRILEALQILLRRAGAVVDAVQSAPDARAILEQGRTDVVVSDISMPVEDGYSLVRRLREASGKAAALPAIAITASNMEADRQRALAAGFDRYLTKPIDLALLIANIAELVR